MKLKRTGRRNQGETLSNAGLPNHFAGAKRQYCESRANSADLDYLTLSEGIERYWVLCRKCADEHVRWLNVHSEEFPSSRDLSEAVDAHMKKWVLPRDN